MRGVAAALVTFSGVAAALVTFSRAHSQSRACGALRRFATTLAHNRALPQRRYPVENRASTIFNQISSLAELGGINFNLGLLKVGDLWYKCNDTVLGDEEILEWSR